MPRVGNGKIHHDGTNQPQTGQAMSLPAEIMEVETPINYS